MSWGTGAGQPAPDETMNTQLQTRAIAYIIDSVADLMAEDAGTKNTVRQLRRKARELHPKMDEERALSRATLYADLGIMPPEHERRELLKHLGKAGG